MTKNELTQLRQTLENTWKAFDAPLLLTLSPSNTYRAKVHAHPSYVTLYIEWMGGWDQRHVRADQENNALEHLVDLVRDMERRGASPEDLAWLQRLCETIAQWFATDKDETVAGLFAV